MIYMYTVNRRIMSRANALLECALDMRFHLTPLELQKLVYIDYGIYLSRGFDVLEEFDFEAWHLGPAIPSIFHYYKHLGSQKIRDKIVDKNKECYTLKDKAISKYTIEMYGYLDANSLIAYTRPYKGAWYKTLKRDKKWEGKINHKDIKDEFVYYDSLGTVEDFYQFD